MKSVDGIRVWSLSVSAGNVIKSVGNLNGQTIPNEWTEIVFDLTQIDAADNTYALLFYVTGGTFYIDDVMYEVFSPEIIVDSAEPAYAGETYTLPAATVKFGRDTFPVDEITVKDKDGNDVPLSDGKFIPEDGNSYNIYYRYSYMDYFGMSADISESVQISVNSDIYSYKIEHYLPNDEGYILYDTRVINRQALGQQVEALPESIDGYIFDESNALNQTQGTVVADNSLTLKLYYKKWIEQPENLLEGFDNMVELKAHSVDSAPSGADITSSAFINTNLAYVKGGAQSLGLTVSDTTVQLRVDTLMKSRDWSLYKSVSFSMYVGKQSYINGITVVSGNTQYAGYSDIVEGQQTVGWHEVTIDLKTLKAEHPDADLSSVYCLTFYIGESTVYFDNLTYEFDGVLLQGFEDMKGLSSETFVSTTGADLTQDGFVNGNAQYVKDGSKSIGIAIDNKNLQLRIRKITDQTDWSGYDKITFCVYLSKSSWINTFGISAGGTIYKGYASEADGTWSAGWHTITLDLARLKEDNPDADLTNVYALQFYVGGCTLYFDNFLAN